MPRKKGTLKATEKGSAKVTPIEKANSVRDTLPRAIPMGYQEGFETAYCLKSGLKYIATQWWRIEGGKKLTAPRTVIKSLRNAGYVR
jgi:hypothetical protein